jgi:hypothetical protein
VRGNTYLAGDVTYADAPGKFGEAADGTKNALALVSGGSIMMGDYLTIRGKNHSKDTQKFPNTAYSIDVRTANKSASVTIDGKKETLNYGYFDPGVIDAGASTPPWWTTAARRCRGRGSSSPSRSRSCSCSTTPSFRRPSPTQLHPPFLRHAGRQPDNIWVYTNMTDEHAVKYDQTDGKGNCSRTTWSRRGTSWRFWTARPTTT